MAELNLIPHELKRGKGTGLRGRNLVIAIVVSALVLGTMIAYPLYSLLSLQVKEKQLKAEVQQGESILKESDKLKKDIDSYTQYITMVTGLTMLKTDSTKTIRGLQSQFLEGADLTSLNYAPGSITVTAVSKDKDLIEVSVANIEESKEYKGARITNMSYDLTKGIWTGTIIIKY